MVYIHKIEAVLLLRGINCLLFFICEAHFDRVKREFREKTYFFSLTIAKPYKLEINPVFHDKMEWKPHKSWTETNKRHFTHKSISIDLNQFTFFHFKIDIFSSQRLSNTLLQVLIVLFDLFISFFRNYLFAFNFLFYSISMYAISTRSVLHNFPEFPFFLFLSFGFCFFFFIVLHYYV